MILKLTGVKYSYNDKDILQNVSFNIEEGERVLLAGSNGSGKSTLLKVIAGIKDSEGVKFNGKRIGYVFQNPEDQFVYERVDEEIAFGLENEALPRELIDSKVNEVLELLKIEHLKERKLNTLSGGQKQLVAIATQLALDVDLIILDEITSMLDYESTRIVNEVLFNIKDLTMLKVSHKAEEAMKMDRVVILDNGSIVKEMTPKQLFRDKDTLKLIRMNPPKEVK